MGIKKAAANLLAAFALVWMIGLSSCTAPKNVAYFQDVDSIVMDVNNAQAAVKVHPSDKLSIIVSSKDPEMSAPFNLPVASVRLGQVTTSAKRETGSNIPTSGANESMAYYTVDPQGNIDFPVLGTIHVGGMTRSEVAGYIKGELAGRGLLNNAIVVVEFVNTGVSVLGEVNSPGRFTLNRDRITVLDALALAGDLTIQGQRENVLVIREENGKRSTYRLDLTKGQQFMNSPAYYLQQDDIVYVEPNAVKKRQTTVNGNNVLSAGFWVSVASLLTSIAVLIFK